MAQIIHPDLPDTIEHSSSSFESEWRPPKSNRLIPILAETRKIYEAEKRTKNFHQQMIIF